MLQEFKKFAMKGNVIDLAVGVIIGGAFGKIVSSLVDDIIMPIMGLLIGGIDFNNLKIVIGTQGDTELAIKYGQFIQSAIDFLIISFSIFLAIKAINSFRRKEDEGEKAAPPEPKKEEILLQEIRDILKEKVK